MVMGYYANPPAFGFECFNTKCFNANIRVAAERWYVENQGARVENGTIESAIKTANVVKMLGWIPFVGALVGLYRIYHATQSTAWYPHPGREIEEKNTHIARGVTEVLTLGFTGIVFAVVDLGMTYYHWSKAAQNPNYSSQIT